VNAADLVNDRVELGLLVGEHDVGVIAPDRLAMGRDDDDVEPVELGELVGGVLGRARHAAQPGIEPQKVLERNRTENATLRLQLEPFLGLQRGLQAVRPVAILDDPAGELIDESDLPVAQDVVDVAPQERRSVESTVQFRQRDQVFGGKQIAAAQEPLGVFASAVGEVDGTAVVVDLVVHLRFQPAHHLGHATGRLRSAVRATGDDQRNAGLVDQQRIGFVDQREVERSLHQLGRVVTQGVPQQVESGFFGSDVGHHTLLNRRHG
jgi:hypothetical protein